MSVLVMKLEIQLPLGRHFLIFLMTQQFVVAYTIPQNIFALLDSWVTNTPSVQMLCPQKRKNCYLYFRKNKICLHLAY